MTEKVKLRQDDVKLKRERAKLRDMTDDQICQLLDLKPIQLGDIKRKIKNANGHIAIMVHPYYSDNKIEWADIHREMYPDYSRVMEKLSKQNTAQLFLFEYERDVPRFYQLANTHSQNIDFSQLPIIGTRKGGSQPIFAGQGPGTIDSGNYEKIARIFKSLGVKSITGYGTYVNDFFGTLGGCLGDLIKKMGEFGFAYNLSRISGDVTSVGSKNLILLKKKGLITKTTGKN
jgi:hypothetical protein